MNQQHLFLPFTSLSGLRTVFFSLFFLFLFSSVRAQTKIQCTPNLPSTATGCFTISATYNGVTTDNISRVCVGTPIQITQCPLPPPYSGGIYNVLYDYDYNNPASSSTSATTHTYTEPGTYIIMQNGSGDLPVTCISAQRQIVVLPANPPVFSLATCSGQKVLLTIPAGDPNNTYDQYVVNWGDNTTSTVTAGTMQHTYAAGSTQTVTVTGVTTPVGCGNSATATVTPVPTLAIPQMNALRVIDNNTVQVQLTPTDDYPTYTLQQKTGTGPFQSIQTVTDPTGAQTLQVGGLNIAANAYCFQVIATDPCGQSINLGQACTIRLQVAAQNRQNVLQWQTTSVPGLQGFNIYRNNQLVQSSGAVGLTTFIDAGVNCSRTYCYRIEARLANPGSPASVSQNVCVTAVSDETPTPLEDFTASIANNQTVLTWAPPSRFAVRSYTVYRSTDGKNFTPYDNISSAAEVYRDQAGGSDSARYCYRMGYVDSCGNTATISSIACPMRLTKVEKPRTLYALAWTPYETWDSGIRNYTVEQLDEAGNVIGFADAGTSLNFSSEELDTTNQVLYFRVKATSGDGSLQSYSNVVKYEQDIRVFLPDAFTPNDDGLNDAYAAKGLFIRAYRMQVYNRWGELIYVSERLEDGWDGKFKGKLSPAGSYVCKVEAFDTLGKFFQKSKIFVLIR